MTNLRIEAHIDICTASVFFVFAFNTLDVIFISLGSEDNISRNAAVILGPNVYNDYI